MVIDTSGGLDRMACWRNYAQLFKSDRTRKMDETFGDCFCDISDHEAEIGLQLQLRALELAPQLTAVCVGASHAELKCLAVVWAPLRLPLSGAVLHPTLRLQPSHCDHITGLSCSLTSM